MKKLILLSFLLTALWSSHLLDYQIYERENRVDLMLSFDVPFDGSIRKQSGNDNVILITLTNIKSDKPFIKHLQHSFIETISLTPSGDEKVLVKIVPKRLPLSIQASKTIDGFGLRFRIVPAVNHTQEHSSALQTKTPNISSSDTTTALNLLKNSDTGPGWRYWLVMAALGILLIILWIIKKRGLGTKGTGWLFQSKTVANQPNLPADATILYQKPLDANNRLMLIEYAYRQYLVIIGQNNILLDTIEKQATQDDQSFSKIFENNQKELDNFLKKSHPDAYEIFKENASKEEYP